jgi:hypothetical protein
MAFTTGIFAEFAKCRLVTKTLATGSTLMVRVLLPMMDAETLVAIAMAEPVTAA